MRMLIACVLVVAFLLASMPSNAGGPEKGADWPQWRGLKRDAVSTETGLLKSWRKEGPPLLWDSRKVNQGQSIGNGFSSLAITQGKIFTLGDRTFEEKVEIKKDAKVEKKVRKFDGCFLFCLDADTGKELWKTKIGVRRGDGPRSTPTVDGDRVYGLTRLGSLACLNVRDGTILWQRDLKADFGGHVMAAWEFSESPTIDGDKLICTPGGKEAALVALNKRTGDEYWRCPIAVDSGAGYASIVSAEVGGIKQYITFLDEKLGLVGVEANTGKLLWNYKRMANNTANIPTPLVHGDRVFASTGYNAGAALLKLVPDGQGGVQAKEEYFLKGGQLQNHHGGMVMLGDYIYGGHGHGNGMPFCLNWKTGKFAWGPERGAGNGSAAALYADGHLYFRYESGEMALIEATPKSYNLVSSFRPAIGGNGWPHPVIYHGKLYLRGEDKVLCYNLKR
jgi:outer membrane protein assembly factor BamB